MRMEREISEIQRWLGELSVLKNRFALINDAKVLEEQLLAAKDAHDELAGALAQSRQFSAEDLDERLRDLEKRLKSVKQQLDHADNNSYARLREEFSQQDVERLMRPWAMGRKAWLFCGSELAGQRAAMVMSLVQSAKLQRLCTAFFCPTDRQLHARGERHPPGRHLQRGYVAPLCRRAAGRRRLEPVAARPHLLRGRLRRGHSPRRPLDGTSQQSRRPGPEVCGRHPHKPGDSCRVSPGRRGDRPR